MSFPFHPSMGEPNQHNQSPSFYGAQTSYQYQPRKEEYFDMNMAYGNQNNNNVGGTGDGFPRDMNESNNDVADARNDFHLDVNKPDRNDFTGDSKENVRAASNGNNGYTLVMDILNQLNDDGDYHSKSASDALLAPDVPPGYSAKNLPQAVPPGSSGEGLPYAPQNWPNPGDNWGWRVGRRVNSIGFYQERFLYLPKSLIGRSSPRQPFGSKPAIHRYLKQHFPGTNVDAFFASFTWRIQATEYPKPMTSSISFIPDASTQVEAEGTGAPGKEEAHATATEGHGKRKAAVKAAANMAAAPYSQITTDGFETEMGEVSTVSRKRRRKSITDKSATPKQKRAVRASAGHNINADVDSSATPKPRATAHSSAGPKRRTRHQPSPTNENDVVQVHEEEPQIDPVKFDKYLSLLDDIIAQPVSLAAVVHDNSYVDGHEIMQARIKLSSLVNMEFPLLFYSNKLAELTDLAAKIRKDPSLTAEQLVKLKLIDEIPMYSQVFLENRQIADQAEQFFATLEANKTKVANLRGEYSGLKGDVTQLQLEVDYSLAAVQEIDEQIAVLKSQRDQLTTAIEDKRRKKAKLNSSQNTVANSIPKVVQEIQRANSKRPEWELKKENAAKREAEILERFISLKGFCL